MKQSELFVVYPVLYVGVGLWFSEITMMRAIFLPAANRASKLLRRDHSLLLFLFLIIYANNFPHFSRYTNFRLQFVFLIVHPVVIIDMFIINLSLLISFDLLKNV